ncbi:MAG: hypothetical protein J5804_03525, partial [Eggerthellaceae bacterium]|nr:hypothetical protein [Eggerthellaceae bacterium]
MTSGEQLKELVEEYCDPHIDEVEWVNARGRARWDYLSLRSTAIADVDWVSRFRTALDGFEGNIDFQVPLPMETRFLRGPYGSGSWYWADTDAEVFEMLRERGASFSFPKPVSGEDGAYANADLVAFFAFCPPGVAEGVLADHGVQLEDIDFSDPDTERVLKVSGNAHAFCW